jgi:hypothetical protein
MHRSFRSNVSSSTITPEPVYRRRREVLQLLGLGAVGLATGCHSETPPAAGTAEKIPGANLNIAHKLDTAAG